MKSSIYNLHLILTEYPHLATYKYPLLFNLPDGTTSKAFESHEEAYLFYDLYVKTHPNAGLEINGGIGNGKSGKTSTTAKTKTQISQLLRDLFFKQKYGYTEEEAKKKQQFLADNGYLTQDLVDGIWDKKSKAAQKHYDEDQQALAINTSPEGTNYTISQEEADANMANYLWTAQLGWLKELNKLNNGGNGNGTGNGNGNGTESGSGEPHKMEGHDYLFQNVPNFGIDLSDTWFGDIVKPAVEAVGNYVNDNLFMNKDGIRTELANMTDENGLTAYEKYWKDFFDAEGYVIGLAAAASALPWKWVVRGLTAHEGLNLYNEARQQISFEDPNAYLIADNGEPIHYNFMTPEQKKQLAEKVCPRFVAEGRMTPLEARLCLINPDLSLFSKYFELMSPGEAFLTASTIISASLLGFKWLKNGRLAKWALPNLLKGIQSAVMSMLQLRPGVTKAINIAGEANLLTTTVGWPTYWLYNTLSSPTNGDGVDTKSPESNSGVDSIENALPRGRVIINGDTIHVDSLSKYKQQIPSTNSLSDSGYIIQNKSGVL